MTVTVQEQGRRIHFGVQGSERGNPINGRHAVRGAQPLRRILPGLRSKEAEPDLGHARQGGPMMGKFFQVVRSCKKLRTDGAVNDDPVTLDVPENAIIRSRSPAGIVFGLKAVNGNDQVQIGEFSPFGRNRPDSAGDDLNFDPHRVELRDETGQLPMTNQRFAADNGYVQRTEAPGPIRGPSPPGRRPAIRSDPGWGVRCSDVPVRMRSSQDISTDTAS